MRIAARAFKAESKSDHQSDDLNHRLWQVQRLLQQTTQRECTAWSLSSAMEIVANHYRAKGDRISTAQRDALLLAVIRAQLSALEHLPPSYRCEQIDAGMQALAGQVMVWAETCERSTQRRQDALADLDAYARMFRNDLHNISLSEEIQRRVWQRRDAEIQKLRPDDGSKAVGV